MLGPKQLGLLICFCSQDKWHVIRSNFFGFRQSVICISGHYSDQKNMANDFFDLKTNFQPIILSTTPTKYHRQYDKLIMTSKNPKKASLNLKSTWNKKSYQDQIYFSWQFQDKKKPFNMSSACQKKQFDTNFNYIDYQNQCQWILSLSSARFQQLTLTSLNTRSQKNKNNEIYDQNWIFSLIWKPKGPGIYNFKSKRTIINILPKLFKATHSLLIFYFGSLSFNPIFPQ